MTLLCSLSLPGMAQEKPFFFGFKVSPGINWYHSRTKGMVSNGPGFDIAAGVIADIRIAGNYFIETGLLYDFQTGSLNYPSIYTNAGEFYGLYGNVTRNYRVQYLDVPISIKMRTNNFGRLSFFGLGGFKTSFRLSAMSDDLWTIRNTTKSIEKEDADKDFALVKESLLLGLGVDVMLDHSTSLTFGVTFNMALSNVAGKDMATYFEEAPAKARFSSNLLELRLGIVF